MRWPCTGHLQGYAKLTRDLTERGGAEATLRSAVGHVVDGIISTDERGTVVMFNPAAERIFGYAASEVIGRNVKMLMPEPYRSEHDGYIADYLRTGHARVLGIGREVSGRRKDGCTFPLDLAVSAFRVGEARYFTGIVRDITDRKRAEGALWEARERLHALVATAVNAIITINQQGVIESVNPAAEKMFGYTGPELIGQNVKVLMPSPHREQHDRYLANYLETGVRKVIGTGREALARRKDGTVFPVDLAVSEIPHLKLFTGIISDITRRKDLEREVLEIAALEERRLGQELHDGLGQQLTGLNLMADALAQRLQTECPALAPLASRIASGLEQAHQQTRSLSWGLVPVEMDGDGLRAALTDLAERTSKQLGVACTLQCAGPVPVADAVAATHLFRIAQEAVSNAVRHGGARNIALAVREEPAALVLSIRDDGKGLPGRPDEARGLGLRLMRYRAGMLGGSLAVGPAEGGGVVVSCTVPRGTRHG